MNERPITADLIRTHRSSILGFASNFTVRRGDPHRVLANATVLEQWLNAATSPGDRRGRFDALNRADLNRSDRRAPDDRPDLFIAEAEEYYAFLKAA